MTAAVRPGDDVHLFILGDEGLLYADAAQEIYALNTTATYVWCQLEEGVSPAAIATAMSATFGFADSEAERHVADILAQWRTLGLLQGANPREPEVPAPPALEADGGLPPFAAVPSAERRHYALLDHRVEVRCNEPAQIEWVHTAIAHLAVATAPADSLVDIVATRDGHLIYLDQSPFCRCARYDQLAPIVKGLIWQLSLRGADYFLNIHAGVVSDGRACTLLPAAPGSGKSSLTAALCRAGFKYFSDEVALLSESTFQAVPVPLSMCFKREGWDLMTPYYPELADLKTHHRGDGKVVRYLSPPADMRPTSNAAQPVRRLIFPRYAADAETALEPIGKVAALHRMMDECLAIPAPLNVERVKAMVDWAAGVECYALPMSSLDDAVALIRALE